MKDKLYHKFRDHCHYTGEYKRATQSICNLKYSKRIPIVFHNESNHDYNLIMKESAQELKKQFSCYEKTLKNRYLLQFQ